MTHARTTLEALIRAELATATLAQLDQQAARLWRELGAGTLDEAAVGRLSEEIHALKRERRAWRPPAALTIVAALESGQDRQERPPAAVSRFQGRSIFPAKKRRERLRERADGRSQSRMLAASGGMPNHIAAGFTSGEQAVLYIVGAECFARGFCDRSIDELADRAGVSASTVKRALRRAEDLALVRIERRPQKGAKHLPNVVRIISKEWSAWLAKRKPIGVQQRPASEIEDLKKRTLEGRSVRPAAPYAWRCGANRASEAVPRVSEWRK